jgi:hypothetical protein
MPRMSAHVQIRQSCARNFDAPGAVFGAAVPGGPPAYPEAWRAAWLPTPRKGQAGCANLSAPCGSIAEEADPPLELLAIRRDGYVDVAFNCPEAPGQSLFSGLFAEPESGALRLTRARLRTDVSLHAKEPCECTGFTVMAAQALIRSGEASRRFRMEPP